MRQLDARVRIANKLGLHLRAAAAFVKVAERFRECDVSMEREGTKANGKSIIALVTLAAPIGTEVRIVVDGPDPEPALRALVTLVEERFGEAE